MGYRADDFFLSSDSLNGSLTLIEIFSPLSILKVRVKVMKIAQDMAEENLPVNELVLFL